MASAEATLPELYCETAGLTFEQNVSNECISKVGASLYTIRLHQTNRLRSMMKDSDKIE
jgi:hypothetical protein